MIPLLAHGALGPFDEIIFFGITLIFLSMMGLSWLRSQDLPEEESTPATQEQPGAEHFPLE